MVCQLLKLALLLLSVTHASSSADIEVTSVPKKETSNDAANGLLITSSNGIPSNKVNTPVNASTEELISSPGTSKDSEVTPEKVTGEKSQETSAYASSVDIKSAKDGLSVAPLNVMTKSDKVDNLIKEHISTKESKVTTKQEASPAGEKSPGTSTFTEDKPLAAPLNAMTTSNKVGTLTMEFMMSNTSTKKSELTTKHEENLAGEASTPTAEVLNTIGSSANGQLFEELNANTPSDNVSTAVDSSTKEPMESHTNRKEAKAIPEEATSPASVIFQEETTTPTPDVIVNGLTTSTYPSSHTLKPITDNDNMLTTNASIIQKDDEMTSSSHLSGKTSTQATNSELLTKKPEEVSNKNKSSITLIVVIMVILILILVTIVVIIVRSKRRRGSKNFQRKSSKKQDVWAGQVPELGDGKMTHHPMGVENGTSGKQTEPPQEQEMITFISAGKNSDSVVEMDELGKGDTMEEKTPLLEDSSQANEEPEKPPVQEQIPTPTVV